MTIPLMGVEAQNGAIVIGSRGMPPILYKIEMIAFACYFWEIMFQNIQSKLRKPELPIIQYHLNRVPMDTHSVTQILGIIY